jgi:hypothetical protein
VQGGDRLPWVAGETLPATMDWEARIYGPAPAALAAWCGEHRLALREIAFTAAHHAAGIKAGALYLLRPDTYVALALAAPDAQVLASYFNDRGLTIGGA